MTTTRTTTTGKIVGDSRYNDAYGAPSDRAVAKLKTHLTPYVQEFIQNAPFAIMATTGEDGRCDASPKGGKPGFVKVLDEKHILFPDVAGNRLFQSYQNIETNPYIGLIFFIPGMNDTVRVNGKVTVVTKEELELQNIELSLYETDDNSKHLQGMLIEVEEAYGHCPRALNFSHLWDPEEIAKNKANAPIEARTDENYYQHEEGK
ncbi:MAG: pyridoxamine 5'-phosphate oxidase family protein [SAR202 cluster bacterium]|uniref:Pyridoxamine 5'-phosphate oxidase N-terminal domain-containing protein n=1 Tax=marine metagenome TaxID=408172 RepID=A0A381QC44_9ZZZZ|nr:pyridoxamine 5'-phosphate oxidase family protein [Chloroflexota bacterium]MEC9289018.1 pyridoxamine 5'-phosphate oxidase family protein [Chloroflexota bacterium]MED5587865.1 pyridoxamine 5'-phosphate oxidase family protein [Chloroflexota bacterium]MEE3166343.1 pyridoxamine 5'-phosphate oxidase family protein [Chloroflexota bacterium]MQG14825.1 pyridoxamine 5'-phosphate oxidase family protein [SAR202 cluster bacterium]|tara:strand:- start:742 stop:1356 length:615 start_codon:yes stop_codon:yes gene_type:complete